MYKIPDFAASAHISGELPSSLKMRLSYEFLSPELKLDRQARMKQPAEWRKCCG